MSEISDKVYDALCRLGAKGAVMQFSGGNDSGGPERAFLVLEDGTTQDMSTELPYLYGEKLTYAPAPYVAGHEHPRWVAEITVVEPPAELRDQFLVSEELYRVMDVEYGSFAGDFSVDGTVVAHREQRVVLMHAERSYSEWTEDGDDIEDLLADLGVLDG